MTESHCLLKGWKMMMQTAFYKMICSNWLVRVRYEVSYIGRRLEVQVRTYPLQRSYSHQVRNLESSNPNSFVQSEVVEGRCSGFRLG